MIPDAYGDYVLRDGRFWRFLLWLCQRLPRQLLMAAMIAAWDKATSRTPEDVWFASIGVGDVLDRLEKG